MPDISQLDKGVRYIIKHRDDDAVKEGIFVLSYKAYEGSKGSVHNAIFKNVTGERDAEKYVSFSSSDYTFETISKGGRRIRKNKRNTLRSAKTLRKNARRGTRRWRE